MGLQLDLECTVTFASKGNNIGEGRRGRKVLSPFLLT